MSQESGYSFLSTGDLTLTNFSSADDVVYLSDAVPQGKKGIVRDLGVIFTTSGGSVYVFRRTVSGSDLRITGNISTTSTGLGGFVLNQGEKIGVKIGSTGSGVITAYDDGVIQDIIKPSSFGPVIQPSYHRRGGF